MSCANLRYVSYHEHSLGHSLLRRSAGLFGRRLHVFVPGCDRDFRHLVTATIACATWLTIGPADTLSDKDFSFLLDLVRKLRGRQQHGGRHLDLKRRLVPICEGFHFNMSFWKLEEGKKKLNRTLFRCPSLTAPSYDVVLRWALQSKGCLDVEVSLSELSLLLKSFSASTMDTRQLNQVHCKILNGVSSSTKGRLSEAYRQMLDLGLKQLINPTDHTAEYLPSAFKDELEKHLEESARVCDGGEESGVEVENFLCLEKSVLSGSCLTILRSTFSSVESKSVSLMKTHMQQKGYRCLKFDFETQLNDPSMAQILFRGQQKYLNDAYLCVHGFFRENDYELVKFYSMESNIWNLKLLILDYNTRTCNEQEKEIGRASCWGRGVWAG